jgi:hypothetical protein
VALMAMFCVYLALIAVVRRNRAIIIAFILAVLLLLYTGWRIHVASSSADYGRVEVGIPLLMQNGRWLVCDAFQFSTSPVFALLIVAALVIMGVRLVQLLRRFGLSLDAECLVLSVGMVCALLAILMISWMPVLRYFYPLIPLLGWHLARGYIEIFRLLFLRPVARCVLNGVTILLVGWFVMANYYNYLLQFAVQYNARNIEQRVLVKMEQFMRAGGAQAICFDPRDPERELASSVRLYFECFLPVYRNETFPLLVLSSPRTDKTLTLASRSRLVSAQWRISGAVTQEGEYRLLNIARRLSGILQGKRQPYSVQDAGTHGFDYEWYFYDSVPGRLVL